MTLITCACGKTIAAKPEWAGIGIRCAGCGRSHTLNAGTPPPPPPAVEVEDPDSKPCPHCAERIKAAAIKCRHCGRLLSEGVALPAPAPSSPSADTGGVGVLIVALVAWLFFCWLPAPIAWVMGSMYESDCRARGVEPSGAGKAGKILGLIGTLLLVLSIGGFVLVAVAGSL